MPTNTPSVRVAVIMAGGSGERFWPLSRARRGHGHIGVKPQYTVAVDVMQAHRAHRGLHFLPFLKLLR